MHSFSISLNSIKDSWNIIWFFLWFDLCPFSMHFYFAIWNLSDIISLQITILTKRFKFIPTCKNAQYKDANGKATENQQYTCILIAQFNLSLPIEKRTTFVIILLSYYLYFWIYKKLDLRNQMKTNQKIFQIKSNKRKCNHISENLEWKQNDLWC